MHPVNSLWKASLRLGASPWFIAGFLIAFIGFGFSIRLMYFNGRGLFQVNVWSYYALTFPKLFVASPLGSGTVSLFDLLTVVVLHVAISVAGGAMVYGLRWLVWKRWRSA